MMTQSLDVFIWKSETNLQFERFT